MNDMKCKFFLISAAFVFERDDDCIILALEEINVNDEFNVKTNQKGIRTLLVH
jgi:hypothetical protein